MNSELSSLGTFERIAATVLSASGGEDTQVNFSDSQSATLRFANNQVVQNVSIRRPALSVRVAFGKKVGRASTNQLDRGSVVAAVRRAEEIASVAPEDPEFLPSLGPQVYPAFDGYVEATANAKPVHQATRTKPVIDLCEEHGLSGAGIMSNAARVSGVAASSGLFAFDRSSTAAFSLTATAADSTGWTMNRHRDVNKLNIEDRARVAVDKALRSREPREVEAGHYTVILEPSATAGLVGPLLWSLGAKSYHKGDSAYAGKLGSVVLDPRLNVRSEPSHAELMGSRFAWDGMAQRSQTWIEKGVLKRLHYDRFTAKEQGVEELIAQTERGILITNFWYIRYVDSTDLTLTGMTRDGTFLVEEGRVVCGVRNFRFHDSPLRAFLQIDAATKPMEATSMERGKMLLPALKLPDFHLSSVTKF